jgi:hypothetical protein
VALALAFRTVDGARAPGDLLVFADTHSLFTFRHRLGPAAPQALLMTWPGLPYYEGAAFVPDSLRMSPAELRAEVAAGRSWWGVRTRHGGISSAAGAAWFDSLGGRVVLQRYPVTVWHGGPPAPAPAAAALAPAPAGPAR